jgi:hypothetical protein
MPPSSSERYRGDIDGLRAIAVMREGGEFISAVDVMCDEQGCLTRLGDEARDITVSDQVHLTEKASVFLVQGIIDRVLGTRAQQ